MSQDLDAFSLTRELLAFNTINPPGQERECAQHLGKLLEDGGFATHLVDFADGRTSIVATIEGADDIPPICFTGHIDTVPLGLVDWKTDPFNGERDGNKLYGRGSTDMKGGVAAMVVAALRMAQETHRKAGITLVITAGEETGCLGAAHLVKLGNRLGKAGAIVVGEPTSNYPFLGHKGVLWLKAKTHGMTAHGSLPHEGVNAIYKAAKVVGKLEHFKFSAPTHAYLGKPTLNVGTIQGGMNINSVPDKAEMELDIRSNSVQSHQAMLEELADFLGKEVELERIFDVEGISSDPQNAWVQQVFEVMTPYLGNPPEARGATYFTDASLLTPAYDHAPTIILGPGEMTMAHKTDEYCYISNIGAITEAYTEIANRWCKPQPQRT